MPTHAHAFNVHQARAFRFTIRMPAALPSPTHTPPSGLVPLAYLILAAGGLRLLVGVAVPCVAGFGNGALVGGFGGGACAAGFRGVGERTFWSLGVRTRHVLSTWWQQPWLWLR